MKTNFLTMPMITMVYAHYVLKKQIIMLLYFLKNMIMLKKIKNNFIRNSEYNDY